MRPHAARHQASIGTQDGRLDHEIGVARRSGDRPAIAVACVRAAFEAKKDGLRGMAIRTLVETFGTRAARLADILPASWRLGTTAPSRDPAARVAFFAGSATASLVARTELAAILHDIPDLRMACAAVFMDHAADEYRLTLLALCADDAGLTAVDASRDP